MSNKNNTKNGFTLIEVLISLSILMIGMVGVLNLMLANVKMSISTENRLVATALAQECVELVRNERDSAWLDNGGESWDKFVDDGESVEVYALDCEGGFTSFSADTANELLNDSTAAVYLQTNGDYAGIYFQGVPSTDGSDYIQTDFYRRAELSSGDVRNASVLVSCEVAWEEAGDREYNVVLREVLYNWYDKIE